MANILQEIIKHIDGTIHGIAGYYTDNDGMQHVIIGADDGNLYEIHWGKQNSPSAPQKLANLTNLICLAGFFSSNSNDQHVIVATSDGDLHDIYFLQPDNPYVLGPLVRLEGDIDAQFRMTGFFSPGDNLCYVATVNRNGELHEITFNQKQLTSKHYSIHFDLKDSAGIAGFFAPDDSSSHIIVASKDGCAYEINYSAQQRSLSTYFLTQFDDHLVDVAAFFSPDTNFRHVIVLTSKGDLYDYSRTIYSEFGKTLLASFSNVVNIAAYYSAYDGYRHVIVATRDGNLHEVYYPRME